MGYTALLFCPDEKTARTVTQVLSELEFSVEACNEPFAAVKKLMGQHFDAVVVDCDNEQNATLLFKSARNSTSNQTSLAVAVVEGQAGVAKAFRIGANLVLTKPINIEQTKGTLRVARGLLRKSEPAKGAAAATSAVAPKPAPPKPNTDLKTASPVASAPLSTPAPQPAAPWPTVAAASTTGLPQDDDLLGIDGIQTPAAVSAAASSETVLGDEIPAAPQASRPASSLITSGGAASAPAPAREPSAPDSVSAPSEKSAEPTAVLGSAPTFSLGGSAAETESSGGSKKVLLGIAAAVIVAAAAYAGWSYLHKSSDQSAQPETPAITAPVSAPQPAKPLSSAPAPAPKAPATSAPESKPSATDTKPAKSKLQDEIDAAADDKNDVTIIKSEPSKPEPAPMVVKGGKVPSTSSKATSDAPAPSMIGMAPASTATTPTIVSTGTPSLKPTLQTLNISQGVSQGLLVKKVPPTYPPTALRMRVEGTVELMATISKSGAIAQVKVLSGDSQLTKAAVDAVKQWKYQPYLLNGEPVEIQTQVTVKFKLPN